MMSQCAISPMRDGREPLAKRKKVLSAKPKIDLLERNTTSLKTPSSCKVWSILECEQVIASYTNPIGKFLREMNTSAEQAVALNLMPYLMEAPSKPRVKYGQRRSQTKEERSQLAKERNREHARRTRRRRSVFKKVTEACRKMMPLPSLLEADTYDDDGSSESDCEEIQVEYNCRDNEIEVSAQMQGKSVGCSATTKDLFLSPAMCKPEKYFGYFHDREINYMRDYSISSAAAVDILESDLNEVSPFDHFEVTRVEQFPYQRMHMTVVEDFINHTSEDTFPERRMNTEFLKYVSSIVPRIMGQRVCHGIPFKMPIVAASVHYSRFADCECQSLQIVVSNCTSVSSLGASQHLHSDPMTSSSRSDLLIFDAQNELSLFLEELQDGLVVKLLLPTEPTTPTPFVDTFTSKEIWKTNNQFFLGAIRQEDCPQETQPILQRFKNLLAYTAPSYYDDPINSPDTVAYTSDYSPTYPSTSAYLFPEGVSIPKKHYRYEAVALKPFGQFQQASSCNFNIYESQNGEKLQPISPICSREDVTSVQLLSVRMCINPLSPPLSGHEEMFDSEKTEYYPVTLVVDYAINLKGGQDYQMLNDATQSSVANDEDNCYIFGTATIKSASYSDTSTVLSPLSVTRPHLEETILASIVVLRSELGIVLRKCEVAINLDYEYILTELAKVIRDALHDTDN